MVIRAKFLKKFAEQAAAYAAVRSVRSSDKFWDMYHDKFADLVLAKWATPKYKNPVDARRKRKEKKAEVSNEE